MLVHLFNTNIVPAVYQCSVIKHLMTKSHLPGKVTCKGSRGGSQHALSQTGEKTCVQGPGAVKKKKVESRT